MSRPARGKHRARPGRRARLARLAHRALTVGLAVLVGSSLVLVGGGYLAGYRTFVVRSGSMGETAPVNSVAIVRPVPEAEIMVGDVIIMEAPAISGSTVPVLHRVIDRTVRSDGTALRTRGDANISPDDEPYVVRGTAHVLLTAVPHAGKAIALLRTRLGWWLFIVLPTALLAAYWLRDLWRRPDPRAAEALARDENAVPAN